MKYLYRIYQWVIAGPIFIMATFITAIITSVGCLVGNGDFWGYWPPHFWSKFTCWIFLIRVKVVGRENVDKNTSYIFVANHQGAYDIFSIYGFLNHNFKWLMKKSLEKIFMVGPACRHANHVFVDDSSVAAIKSTIEKAEKTLKGGMSLVIFPEGTRSWDGKMMPFKRGAFMLAGEFKLPVVPLSIEGSFNRMPRYTYNMTPGTITITIHKPIQPGPKGFNTKALLSECYDTIQTGLNDENKGSSSMKKI